MRITRRMACLLVFVLVYNGILWAQQEKAVASKDTVSTTYVMPEVVVVGQAENLAAIPGSASVLNLRTLENSRPFTANEAVRKFPGVNVRDEEGFGLRPNIGIR